MTRQKPRVIAIGASSGGLNAIADLVAQFPEDLNASIFIVLHMAPDALKDVFLDMVQARSRLKCLFAENGMAVTPGRIHLAPPDHHLLVKKGEIIVSNGARENRFRPSIDTLFRSAAVACGSSVIGIILTGMLDDGILGLKSIKQCGGTSIVQDPSEAAYPNMPQAALTRVHVDYSLPISEMGAVLRELIRRPGSKKGAVPPMLAMEARIAERVTSDLEAVEKLGRQAPYNCPGCGGTLWKVAQGKIKRFRCHVGHAYTITTLMQDQSEKIEETLWMALRMFEERKNLLLDLSKDYRKVTMQSASQRLEETNTHIGRIQDILLSRNESRKKAG
jgi:two-component system, chemotaxis family, protein-glutamate methylesterase/glutaminase